MLSGSVVQKAIEKALRAIHASEFIEQRKHEFRESEIMIAIVECFVVNRIVVDDKRVIM
jgi:hypothetical protein